MMDQHNARSRKKKRLSSLQYKHVRLKRWRENMVKKISNIAIAASRQKKKKAKSWQLRAWVCAIIGGEEREEEVRKQALVSGSVFRYRYRRWRCCLCWRVELRRKTQQHGSNRHLNNRLVS